MLAIEFGERGGEEIGEAAAERLIPGDAGQVLDLRIPALHPVFQIGGEDAHVGYENGGTRRPMV